MERESGKCARNLFSTSKYGRGCQALTIGGGCVAAHIDVDLPLTDSQPTSREARPGLLHPFNVKGTLTLNAPKVAWGSAISCIVQLLKANGPDCLCIT